jgi:methyl-accepting chemotaxis protein
MRKKFSLRAKLALALVLFGSIPAGTLALINYAMLESVATSLETRIESDAMQVADTIDRNLFERYGDAQAFGYNQVVHQKEHWYLRGASSNPIVGRMNDYVRTYGIYYLTILLDPSGKVVAVNDKDSAGQSINSDYIYSQDFSSATWLADAKAGHFYTADGYLTGTVVDSFYRDPMVKQIYGDDGYSIGFSAPVKDDSGNVIAVWRNVAKFSLVEDIIATAHDSFGQYGLGSANITLLDENGLVLVDYDRTHFVAGAYRPNPQIVGNLNLVGLGLDVAKLAVQGKTGHARSLNPRNNIWQLAGYTKLKGAMGFKGMPWSVLVQVDQDEVLAPVNWTRLLILVTTALSILAVILMGSLMVKRTVSPINAALKRLLNGAKLIAKSANVMHSSSQQISVGTVQQASAIQESVAALSEMSGMISQTAEHSRLAREEASTMAQMTDAGRQTMERMVSSMEAIHQANGQLEEMSNIISQISAKTAIINDIVFKTQLLSFNASIEAARAGQHGRGFAVVAEEVGNLAEMSGSAAKEIQALLEDSRRQVSEIVSLTQARVNEGHQVSKESLRIFSSLASKIQTVSGQVESISDACREQENGILQATTAINEMDSVARRNNQLAAETLHVVADLSAESADLSQVVDDVDSLIDGRVKTIAAPNGSTKHDRAKRAAGRSQKHPLAHPKSMSYSDLDSLGSATDKLLKRSVQKPTVFLTADDTFGDLSADDDSFKPIEPS